VKLLDVINFFQSPTDRAIIERWTTSPDLAGYAMEMPQPQDPERFCFLALGDSGDSAGLSNRETPQDAVAQFLAAEAIAPVGSGRGEFVLHTGDVVYMTGERRLYDRNFRRPYAPFLTPESTVGNFVFRVPFLAVPGNHDYYDYAGWATRLARTPLLGPGIAALARKLFGFHIPQGGSDMGAAFMEAFVAAPTNGAPAQYEPGVSTQAPNRYYRFRVGTVDFFALDSNTLESPPPSEDLEEERHQAALRVKELEQKSRVIARAIRREEAAVQHWMRRQRQQLVEESGAASARQASAVVVTALRALADVVERIGPALSQCQAPLDGVHSLLRTWESRDAQLQAAQEAEQVTAALEALDHAADTGCELFEAQEACFAELPEGAERAELLAARDQLAVALETWQEVVTGTPPPPLCARLTELSATAIDLHRSLALERRRMDRHPDDFDQAQLDWLRASLDESERENPAGWRVVFLHQPLYTTIGNHSENADVVGVRENLEPLFGNRVHLVLAGHAHAFEWFQTRTLPHTGMIVTGAGGQPWLWPSILEPRVFRRHRRLYRSLQRTGVREGILAGNGPPPPEGGSKALYHYLRIEVTPEALRVVPVGVRRVASGWRTESPMPVYHVPEFPPEEEGERPELVQRQLEAIEVRRGQPPRPRWA
jgi:hypothetical protein